MSNDSFSYMKNIICRCLRVIWLSICADYIPWKFSNIKNETNRYSDEINRMYLVEEWTAE